MPSTPQSKALNRIFTMTMAAWLTPGHTSLDYLESKVERVLTTPQTHVPLTCGAAMGGHDEHNHFDLSLSSIAITKYFRQDNLQRIEIWLMVLEAGKSKSMVPAPTWHLMRAFLMHHNMTAGITGPNRVGMLAHLSFPPFIKPLMPSRASYPHDYN